MRKYAAAARVFRKVLVAPMAEIIQITGKEFRRMQLIQLDMKRGIRIPRDLSVVSIDNSDLAVISPVPITSCLHPKEKLGIRAAENLLKMIEDPSFDGSGRCGRTSKCRFC